VIYQYRADREDQQEWRDKQTCIEVQVAHPFSVIHLKLQKETGHAM
jgi:hypothetical protein